jgi:sugar transferase (PEP-CTERM system associated)
MFKRAWRSAVLVAGETVLLVTAVVVSSYIYLGPLAWDALTASSGMLRAMLIVFVCQVSLHYSDLYDLGGIADTRDLVTRLLRAIGATSLILGFAYLIFPSWIIERGVFLLSAALAILLVVAWRRAFEVLARRVAPRERLLLVGTGPGAVTLARELFQRRLELGVDIVGFVDPDPARIGEPVINPGVIGTIDDIPSLVSKHGVDRVVVSLSDQRGKLPMERLLDVRMRTGVLFDHLASVYEEYTGKIAVENLRPSWLVFSTGFRKTRVLMAAKRAFDVMTALVGLVVFAPLMLAIAAIMKISSRDPVLYHQERVGLNGRVFTVHKFRTMQQDAEAGTGPVWSRPGDSRVTSLGGLMRKARLDELPQLWNVLRGDMSLVGPRPERPSFVEQLTTSIPFYGQRHVIKPGLTGWAQVRYTYGASVEDAIEKLQYDLYYIKNVSLLFDFVIALETIKTVVLRRGAR